MTTVEIRSFDLCRALAKARIRRRRERERRWREAGEWIQAAFAIAAGVFLLWLWTRGMWEILAFFAQR